MPVVYCTYITFSKLGKDLYYPQCPKMKITNNLEQQHDEMNSRMQVIESQCCSLKNKIAFD